MQPRAEGVGHLGDPQIAARRRHHVEQDLEALDRELRRQLFETIAADHEEAAHRVGDLDAQHALRDGGGELAGAEPLAVETVGAAAVDVAAADHQFGGARFDQAEHLRQLRFVMLQVAVDHRRAGRAGGQHAFDAGAGQAAAADPPDAAHARIALRQRAHHVGGAVRRVVIDEDDLPGDAGQRNAEALHQHLDIAALVEGGNDDGQLQRSPRLQELSGFRSDGFIHDTAYIRHAGPCQGEDEIAHRNLMQVRSNEGRWLKTSPEMPTTLNNMARVHPALPSYPRVVPAPEAC